MRMVWGGVVLGALVVLPAALCAAESEVKSADEIVESLARGINVVKIVPKTTAQGQVLPETAQHVSLTNVLFALNSAELLPVSARQLDQVAIAMQSKALKDFRLLIEGHTCDRGTAEHNQGLSERRAVAARAYLIAKGVAPERLSTRGWGETRPVADNVSEALRARNRRVDLVKLEAISVAPLTRGLPAVGTRGVTVDKLLDVTFLGRKKGTATQTVMRDRAELASGDMFQVKFDVVVGCHVYVLFLSSQGEVTWLFPTEDVKYGRWCYAGKSQALPEQGKSYLLDDNTGDEVICVIASPKPLPDAEGLPALLKGHRGAFSTKALPNTNAAEHVQVELVVLEHK